MQCCRCAIVKDSGTDTGIPEEESAASRIEWDNLVMLRKLKYRFSGVLNIALDLSHAEYTVAYQNTFLLSYFV